MKFEQTESFRNYKTGLKVKEKTLLQGDDVVHLTYLAPLVDNQILKELRNDLKTANIRLSSWDDYGAIKASIGDYSLQIYLAVCNPITLEILKTVGLNTLWEVIKHSTLKLHNTIFRANRRSENAKHISRQINFGIKMKVNDKISFDFKLDGDLSDELILKSMDKALDFIKEHDGQSIPVHELPIFSTLNPDKKSWKRVNVLEKMKKRHKKK